MKLPDYPEHTVQVRYATEHRCGVVIKGPSLSDAISGTDPLKDNLPLQPCAALDDSHEVGVPLVRVYFVTLRKTVTDTICSNCTLHICAMPSTLLSLGTACMTEGFGWLPQTTTSHN